MDSPKPVPVPENAELQDDLGPFAAASLRHAAEEKVPSPLSKVGSQQGKRRCSWCCCFKGSAAKADTAAGNSIVGPLSTTPSKGSTSLRLSLSSLGHRKLGHKSGSHAYSDAEWYDALSRFDSPISGDHASALAEVDQMVKELAVTGPWVPDPPLLFGGPHMHFVPFPLDVSRFTGHWVRDDERTTSSPFPIDVMLRASFLVQKVHESIRTFALKETDRELSLLVKPTFTPPGLVGYMETYDKLQASETSWHLRRDLKPGRSCGHMYMTSDGTLVFRVHMRPLLSNSVDVIAEDYLRLEEGGKVLVMRVCCLQVSTGKKATQYVVGRRQDHVLPAK